MLLLYFKTLDEIRVKMVQTNIWPIYMKSIWLHSNLWLENFTFFKCL